MKRLLPGKRVFCFLDYYKFAVHFCVARQYYWALEMSASEAGAAAGQVPGLVEAVLRQTLDAREREISEIREYASLERQAYVEHATEQQRLGGCEVACQAEGAATVGGAIKEQQMGGQEQQLQGQGLGQGQGQVQNKENGGAKELIRELARVKGELASLKQLATQEYLVGGDRRALMEQAARVVSIVD